LGEPPRRSRIACARRSARSTVAQLLGHKDLRMASRYQHLSPAFLADAVKRLDTVFGDLSRLEVTHPLALGGSA
jgi:hypothetical protein